MKKLLLVFLTVSLFSPAQTHSDTIFKKDGSKIICSINEINSKYLIIQLPNSQNLSVPKETVEIYSINGMRTTPGVPTENVRSSREESYSYSSDTVSIGREFAHIKRCLLRSHKEFSTGLVFVAAGISISSIAVLSSTNEDLQSVSRAMLYIGPAATLAGLILMIDSHKWLKRAGLGVNGRGSEFSVNYRF